ncbi:hypothetical protein KAFR_0F00400 [Kazachstania africana CBS 2517]|uniref:Uncharacterized protein n=1 Tax=Kazachstania africana (strain ATCC 22294 / BCRC 22015 / CBS 2517 / CECT 1963 / NBRC 1671 / NRRL Y-8276) TaxID=1071382 RepID=H2AW87_KAZAF|nr:hypothetical protein KAFR_0F00400 [Kazachstania africana CBS 2517]CCF58637.1 hypothetical protein KAFR_0F00400 [Kazachstania africana CBS 2517]
MKSIKCVVVGDGAVGKTSLLVSYINNSFPFEYVPTVFDNYSATIYLNDSSLLAEYYEVTQQNDHVFHLNLWDTAGQEAFDKLRPLSYTQTNIFIVCFAINENDSLQHVRTKWIPEISQASKNSEPPNILLVGTKGDLRDTADNCIPRTDIEHVQNHCGSIDYIECSARMQQNVKEVFTRAVEIVASRCVMKLIKQTQIAANDNMLIPAFHHSVQKKPRTSTTNNKMKKYTRSKITRAKQHRKTLNGCTIL